MIRHAFKIIFNQRRRNVWLVLELFLVFSIIWFVYDHFTVLYLNSRAPVGVEIDNTYLVRLSFNKPEHPDYIKYEEGSEEPARNFMRIVDRIRSHPSVEAVSIGQFHYPYCTGSMGWYYRVDTLVSWPTMMNVTPEYFDVFKVKPSDGSSPDRLKEALANGVIISKTVEEKLFPNAAAVGQTVYDYDTVAFRVSAVSVPVKRAFYQRYRDYAFQQLEENRLFGMDDRRLWNMISICFRARPATDEKEFAEAFKQEMGRELKAGNFFVTDIIPISKKKEDFFVSYGVYEAIQYRVAFSVFFLVNVFLGTLGAFWLRVKKRRPEIGLRIAAGASRKAVVAQMMAESLLLALVALVPACVVWVNLVLVDVMPVDQMDMTAARFAMNSAVSIVTVLTIVAIATVYPARRAAHVQPAEALHFDNE